jgi:hypothetical protein
LPARRGDSSETAQGLPLPPFCRVGKKGLRGMRRKSRTARLPDLRARRVLRVSRRSRLGPLREDRPLLHTAAFGHGLAVVLWMPGVSGVSQLPHPCPLSPGGEGNPSPSDRL